MLTLSLQMFKGFDKVEDIEYIYTPPYDSLCGVKLNTKNNNEFLLSGTVWFCFNETMALVSLKIRLTSCRCFVSV